VCVFSLVSLNHPKFLQRVESLQVEVILDHCKPLYSNQKNAIPCKCICTCITLQDIVRLENVGVKLMSYSRVALTKAKTKKKSLFQRNCNADVYLVYSL